MNSSKWLAEASFGRRSSLNQLDILNQLIKASTPNPGKSTNFNSRRSHGNIFQFSPIRPEIEKNINDSNSGHSLKSLDSRYLMIKNQTRRASCGPALLGRNISQEL